MRSTFAFLGALLLAATTAAFAETASPAVADELMALVKAEWAANRARNVVDSYKNAADDYTEFNAEAATRVEGKGLVSRLAEASNKDGGTRIADEMLNPKVQVYGDTAILTYNFFGLTLSKDGKVEPGRAKSTRVYVKAGGKWMLVHANFAPDPLPR